MPPPRVTFEPAQTYEQALHLASQLRGVQPEYWDIFGNRHVATPQLQQLILTSLGMDTASLASLNAAIEDQLWQEWSGLVPFTTVASEMDVAIAICIPRIFYKDVVIAEVQWEDGRLESSQFQIADLLEGGEAELRGTHFVRKRLPLPAHRPLGYHKLQVSIAREEQRIHEAATRLIICPNRAYESKSMAAGKKAAGVALSVYGLRSARNWGCGDFTDLCGAVDWMVDEVKGSFLALNPLHAIPNRQPYNTSPYLPNCSFYRNPLYLDIEKVEDFARSKWAGKIAAGPTVQQEIRDLRASEHVEYEKVYALKLRMLKLLFRTFLDEQRQGSGRAEAFQRFVEAEGDLLHGYAVYCALDERLHKQDPNLWIWPDWPAEFKDSNSPAVREFAESHRRSVLFYKYVQWQVDLQLGEAQQHALARGLEIGLYHDLALATDRCGSDLWAHGSFYVNGCRVGSPPDDFSPNGQDWGFPPPHSMRHREDGYRLFIESIRKNCKHGGALRIDHVMRFFRLFWIPDQMDATQGAYVRDYDADLLHILALESVRNRVVVIGEDLGTVEPEIRDALHRFGILSYRLLYFEKNGTGDFRRPDEYPRQALVSVSTHDLPTLAGFWTHRDIEARRAAGLLPDDDSYREQIANRTAEKQKMLDLFWRLNLLPSWFPRRVEQMPEFTGELHNAAVGFLALTPSLLMVLNQEDLFKDRDQQNLPGSTHQYPNWRHKMRYTLEQMRSSRDAKDCVAMFRSWLQRTGRST
ncbi:MAG TPA: 4-alpha-glucanotransferase [Bryobacteraceae bacterium]|nr:4-alpha-glucanotransferase [Bryobacteraceae bacterium]